MSAQLVGGPCDGRVIGRGLGGHTIYLPLLKEMRPENWHPDTFMPDGGDTPETCSDETCRDMGHFFYCWAYVLRDGEYRYDGEVPA